MAVDVTEGDTNQSTLRKQWVTGRDDATHKMLSADERYFMRQSLSTPCLDEIVSAEGARFTCRDGRTVLDFHGNNVHNIGHRHPAVVEAIRDQMDQLPFCPRRFTNRPAVQLAKALIKRSPDPLQKVLFAPGGAEAIGMALKVVRMATGRYKTLSFWDSFHGASLDAISIGGEALFRHGMEPLLHGALHVPPPIVPASHRENVAVEAMRDPEIIDYVMRKEEGIGALIAEPFRYSLAMDPPTDYWKTVQRICRRHGALLVFDEMPVCMGRTGAWFACTRYDVTPDILVIGKSLGGGIIPFAGILTRKELDCGPDTSFGHYTHEKNPLGAVAALAMIDVIERDDLLRQTRRLGRQFLAQLQRLQQKHPAIGSVHGIGLQLAVEFVTYKGAPANSLAEKVLYDCLQRGLSFKISMGNILSWAPPMTLQEQDKEEAIAILDASLQSIAGGQVWIDQENI